MPSLHEGLGEVFEQFRIGGAFAAEPKLLGLSTMPVPKCSFQDAVHDDAHGDGLLQNQVRQLQTAAALSERYGIVVFVGEDAEEVAGNFGAEILRVAAQGQLNCWQAYRNPSRRE